MKKLLVAMVLIATSFTSAIAKPLKVNNLILKSFAAEFTNVSFVTWTTTADYTKAEFVFDNQKMKAFYSPAGEKIGMSTAISLTELPFKVKRAFAKKYIHYNVMEVIFFECADENAYYISAEDEKEKRVIKANDDGSLSTFKKTKK